MMIKYIPWIKCSTCTLLYYCSYDSGAKIIHRYFKIITDNDLTVQHWRVGGSTVVTGDYLRLTPDRQSKRGSLWNNKVAPNCKNSDFIAQFTSSRICWSIGRPWFTSRFMGPVEAIFLAMVLPSGTCEIQILKVRCWQYVNSLDWSLILHLRAYLWQHGQLCGSRSILWHIQ